MARPANQELQQRLLRVPAILGLVPDPLPVAVEDRSGDLLPGVRGEAVQREGAGSGLVEQLVGDRERGERLTAGGRGGLVVAHADPDVGVDDVRALDGLGGIVEELRVGDCVEVQQTEPVPGEPNTSSIFIYRTPCQVKDGVENVDSLVTKTP